MSKRGIYSESRIEKLNGLPLLQKGEDKIHEVFEHQLTFQTSIVNECLTEEEQKTLYMLMTKLQKNTESKMEN